MGTFQLDVDVLRAAPGHTATGAYTTRCRGQEEKTPRIRATVPSRWEAHSRPSRVWTDSIFGTVGFWWRWAGLAAGSKNHGSTSRLSFCTRVWLLDLYRYNAPSVGITTCADCSPNGIPKSECVPEPPSQGDTSLILGFLMHELFPNEGIEQKAPPSLYFAQRLRC